MRLPLTHQTCLGTLHTELLFRCFTYGIWHSTSIEASQLSAQRESGLEIARLWAASVNSSQREYNGGSCMK